MKPLSLNVSHIQTGNTKGNLSTIERKGLTKSSHLKVFSSEGLYWDERVHEKNIFDVK